MLEESVTGVSGSDAMPPQLLLDPLISHLKLKTQPGSPGQLHHGPAGLLFQKVGPSPAAPLHTQVETEHD